MWHLPDGSVRVCDFLSNVSSSAVAMPAWLTTLSDFSVASGACSIFFLALTFITYSVFPALRNQPGQIVMNLMAALILAQSVLMTGYISVAWLCTLKAAVLHMAWLAVFMWMSITAWDISYRMQLNRLISVREEPNGHKVLKLGLFAWGLPAVFVSACYLMSKLSQDQPWTWLEYGGRNCWIVEPLHSLLAFGVPVAVIILINCVLLVFMIYKVIVNRKRLAAAQLARSAKTELLLCSKIIVLTGMTWTLFLAANLLDIVAIWYISVVANSLQGALIGMIFLWNEHVRSLWRQKLFGRGGQSSQERKSARSEETAPPSNKCSDDHSSTK
ncbi:G-protein coupled receptor Mth2-like [Asterias amurensis]|uniref:G-protein coupled receptor Mth2-like n=1 Tax=Asterias amurensis TaxID=7602 RepID=UPI003AB3F5E6